MESTEQRRAALQMADLGTDRREEISTAEDPRRFTPFALTKRHVDDLRQSVKNPAMRQLEAANKTQLAAWTRSDIADLENLDSMLDGQSHRAQLHASMQMRGGQQYMPGSSNDRKRNFSESAIGSRGRGRGGGVVGTRGRGDFQPSVRNSSTSSFLIRGGFGPKNRPRGVQRCQDPALEPSESLPTIRPKFVSRAHRKMTAGIMTRRPLPSHAQQPSRPRQSPQRVEKHFQQQLAGPDTFMAACRTPSRSVTAEKRDDNASAFTESKGSTAKALDKPSELAISVTDVLDTDLDSIPCKPGNFESPQANISPTKIVRSGSTGSETETMSIQSTDARIAEVIGTDAGSNPKGPSPPHTKLFSSNLPRPQISPMVGNYLERSASRARIEQPGLLLEFDPPVPPSPAVRDLMNIEFRQILDTSDQFPTTVEQEQSSTVKRESGQASEVREPDEVEASSAGQSSPTPDIVDYLEELGLINDALAIPRHNNEKTAKLVQRKEKLIELIAKTRSKIAEGTTELVPQSADLALQTSVENTAKPIHVSNEMEMLSIQSPLQKAVRAAPFVPRSAQSSVLSSCNPSPVRGNIKSAFPNDEATIWEHGTIERSPLSPASTTGSVLRTAVSDRQRDDNRRELLTPSHAPESGDPSNAFSSSVSFGSPTHLRSVSNQSAHQIERNNRPLFNTPASVTSSGLRDSGPGLFMSRYATPTTETSPGVGQSETGNTVRSSKVQIAAPVTRSLVASRHASTAPFTSSETDQRATSEENTHYWRKNLYSSRHASVQVKPITDSDKMEVDDAQPSPQRSPVRSISLYTSRYAF